MTKALFETSEILAKFDGQAIGGPEALSQLVAVATVSAVETLLELLRSQQVSDVDGIAASAVPKPRAKAPTKAARTQRRLTDAAKDANRATRAKQSQAVAQAEHRKLHAEAAKTEAEAKAIETDAKVRQLKAMAEVLPALLEAIATVSQSGGAVFFSKQNLMRIVRSSPATETAISPRFQVFLSHNSKDKLAIRELKKRLIASRLKVWLDEDELRPGIPWQQLLEAGIRESASIAVVVGKDGLGPWEDEEMQGALRLAVKEKRPVIPVLLPGAAAQPDLPMFLTNRTWVDLREGFTDVGLAKLVWGITGEKP